MPIEEKKKICRGSQTSRCWWLSGRSNKGGNPSISV
ncbi:hypothetical protein CIPAW_06G067200 [Carya illinoinensis]|uniref:Uncharacterized protein n=1 Tax=Carya illinoinensis TaxID=32201 RepID=A0A8T1Q8R1_CARIL|nr:hypothetical protein CIPAW_06G067200 [Carya illinoinensis]